MQWIRENLFLTCLAGALVVAMGVSYVIRSGQDSAFIKDMEPRKRLARRIHGLRSRPAVDDAMVQKALARLKEIRRQRRQAVIDASNWNKRNYSVLRLKSGGGPADIQPAFPYKPAEYLEKGLTTKFTNTYRIELYKALAALNLTTWPTEAEITQRSKKISSDIQARRKAAVKRVDYAKKRSGAGAKRKPIDEGDDPPEEEKPKGVSQADWDDYRLTEGAITNLARRNATDELMIKKASAGMVFVTPETMAMVTAPTPSGGNKAPEELDVIFPKEIWQSANAPAEKLWEAQLNLWISKDILSAINATNRAAVRLADGRPTVPNAAVKQLLQIMVEEQYLMPQPGPAGKNNSDGLTQRATTKEYEIIEYRVLLVMNTSSLPALLRNLTMRGDHTITHAAVKSVPVEPDGKTYYGPEPVSRVEISGEALFRADWTRTKLMPVELLKGRLSPVLRKEDQKRLRETK